jgi:hypothetical protein
MKLAKTAEIAARGIGPTFVHGSTMVSFCRASPITPETEVVSRRHGVKCTVVFSRGLLRRGERGSIQVWRRSFR